MVWLAGLGIALGLVLLVAGAELLVRGASRLALALGVGPLAVGLTVVAFGTSAPEFLVTAIAAVDGHDEMAVGNVVGSNVFNLLVVLGATALVAPLLVQSSVVRREVPILLGVSLLVWLFALGGIGRWEGIVLVAGLAGYTAFTYRAATRAPPPGIEVPVAGSAPAGGGKKAGGGRWFQAGMILAGLVLLVAGGRLTVSGAQEIATEVGISDRIVGLTVLAVGTSLPELFTSVVAAIRRQADIAVGNVLGSNLFNLLGVLGVASILQPLHVPSMVRFDLPVMVFVTLVAFPPMWTGKRLSRPEAVLLLALYPLCLFLLYLF